MGDCFFSNSCYLSLARAGPGGLRRYFFDAKGRRLFIILGIWGFMVTFRCEMGKRYMHAIWDEVRDFFFFKVQLDDMGRATCLLNVKMLYDPEGQLAHKKRLVIAYS